MAGPIGLFNSFAPPGVYTRTLLDQSTPSILGGLRIPMLVGPADECKTVFDEELFRGSSAVADNPIFGEDLSSQVDGTTRTFTTARFPLVDGTGTGTITNDPNAVRVTVDGVPVVVVQVVGLTGTVQIQTIPLPGEEVKIDYFFKRGDTFVEDEDVSAQFGVTPVSVNTFTTVFSPIVDGSGGGIITNDPSDVTVTVDGAEVTVTSVDGALGQVTLELTPAAGSDVRVDYYYNQFRDTADSLRFPGVKRTLRVGTTPGRTDFIEDVDYTIFEDEIHWGSVVNVETAFTTVGTTPLSDLQVMTTLRDDRVYAEQATGTVDTNNRTFTVAYPVTDGTGTGQPTNDTSMVIAYVGPNVRTAIMSGPVTVARLTGETRTLVLDTAPVPGNFVFVTYYRNRLSDAEFTVESTLKGGAGVGTYSLRSETADASLALVEEGVHSVTDPNFAIEGIRWPNDAADFLTSPGFSVSETVTLTFFSPWEYTVTSDNVSGSGGLGETDQTYEDAVTGLSFTVLSPIISSYLPGDTLEFVVTVPGSFTAGSDVQRAIPGVWLTVLDLVNVVPGNQATVRTFRGSGNEPAIGDFYYVSYEYQRDDFTPKVFTDFNLVQEEYGPLRADNPLVLAGYLAFQQAAVAVGFKQVSRSSGAENASAQDYIAAFEELETPFGGGFTADYITPLTSDPTVLGALKKHCEVQSSPRYQNECRGIVGMASGTTPAEVRNLADSLNSFRMQVIYPDSAIVALEDANGVEIQYAVDGTYVAAAFAGLRSFPDFDVAEPMTRKTIAGFVRLGRQLTRPEQDQTILSGVTVLRDLATSLQVIMSVSTDMSTVLTRSPNIIGADDLLKQTLRVALDTFIGRKFLASVLGDVEDAVGAVLSSFVTSELIAEYQQISAVQDQNDPTILRVSFAYLPIFPLNWIEVTLQLQSRLN